jgi:cytochrome c oxidase subunit II
MRWQRGVLVVGIGAALSGCTANPSPFAPKSAKAQEITDLFSIIHFFGGVVFLVVAALVLFAVYRFSRDKTPGEPQQLYGNTRLEVAWTALPALLLVVVLGLTVNTMASTRQPAEASYTIRVIGHQWWWEIIYPDQRIVTASDMHIPVGVPIYVEVESVDVQHSWWVPELSGKIDAYPGRVNRTWIQADEPGRFRVHCSEFCGTQHANMAMYVIAQPQAEFDAWVARTSQPAPPELWPENDPVAAVFTQCIGCHAINGSTVAKGVSGPNLTNFGARTHIAAGVLDMNEENLKRWLRDPNEVKPGTLMGQAVRRGSLSEEEIDVLTRYLLSLK